MVHSYPHLFCGSISWLVPRSSYHESEAYHSVWSFDCVVMYVAGRFLCEIPTILATVGTVLVLHNVQLQKQSSDELPITYSIQVSYVKSVCLKPKIK